MKPLLLLLFLLIPISVLGQQPTPSPTPTPTVVKTIRCERMKSTDSHVTTLNCGKDDAGQPNILDIPDTKYTFDGKAFTIEVMSDGSERFAERQPEDSSVTKTPRCEQRGYQRRALQAPPCDPDP